MLLAATGSEGVTLLRDHPGTIDLLLTDVVLPELSGPEVAFEGAKLRPRMKILFTSGYAHDTPGFKPETLPASAFLPKPYSSAGLARSVRALLDDDAD